MRVHGGLCVCVRAFFPSFLPVRINPSRLDYLHTGLRAPSSPCYVEDIMCAHRSQEDMLDNHSVFFFKVLFLDMYFTPG